VREIQKAFSKEVLSPDSFSIVESTTTKSKIFLLKKSRI